MDDDRHSGFRDGSAHDDEAFVLASRPWDGPSGPGLLPPGGGASQRMEPAWQATRALQGVASDELRDVLAHPGFRRMPQDAQVPLGPCRICRDGTLHTAGTLQTRLGQLLVCACDICGLVDLDLRLVPCH